MGAAGLWKELLLWFVFLYMWSAFFWFRQLVQKWTTIALHFYVSSLIQWNLFVAPFSLQLLVLYCRPSKADTRQD